MKWVKKENIPGHLERSDSMAGVIPSSQHPNILLQPNCLGPAKPSSGVTSFTVGTDDSRK